MNVHSNDHDHDHDHDELGTGAIIDVLTNLHPDPDPDPDPVHQPSPSHDDGGDDGEVEEEGQDLEGWTAEDLRAEVLRLRRITRGEHPARLDEAQVDPTIVNEDGNGQHQHASSSTRVARKRKRESGVGSVTGKGKKKDKVLRDDGSGKRVEKTRRPELSKAIRTRMRDVLGVGAEDPLPPPTNGTTEGYYVPNWTNITDENHNAWIEGIARDVIMAPAPKISPEDLDWHIVLEAAKTSFMNLCKKYIAENDPRLAGRRERYTKGRRRWARKDLKQKKRTRASLDPTFLPSRPLPPTALGMDYMSSEYSSAGEDSDDADENVREIRRAKWTEVLSSKNKEDEAGREGRGKAGWAEGLGEKILEVRRARWRSDGLNAIYAQLDSITSSAAAQRSVPAALALPSSSGLDLAPRSGHVAPSHSRFIMPLEAMRKGRAPRGDQGEGWMWASGEVGVWLDRHHSTVEDTIAGSAQDDHPTETKYGRGDEDEGHPEIDWEAGTMNLVDALVGFGAESGHG